MTLGSTHEAVAARKAGCVEFIVQQVRRIDCEAPTLPVDRRQSFNGGAGRRHDRIEGVGRNGGIGAIGIEGTGRFALAVIDNASAQAQPCAVGHSKALDGPDRETGEAARRLASL